MFLRFARPSVLGKRASTCYSWKALHGSAASQKCAGKARCSKMAIAAVGAGALAGSAVLLWWEPANRFIYKYAGMPLMKKLDPELAHRLAIFFSECKLSPIDFQADDPVLHTSVLGLNFKNPVGLGAGYDKQGTCIDASFSMGMGFQEIGTVTPQPQPGNPKPRMFRLLEDKAVINRVGFNSVGADAVQARLNKRVEKGKDAKARGNDCVLGINVGKNKESTTPVQDYVTGVQKLGPYADFIVVNVSSPNTPGLRGLQKKEHLTELLDGIKAARDGLQMTAGRTLPPVLVKIAPDLTEEEKADIAALVLGNKADGLVVSNTTISRPDGLRSKHATETGGLSGPPLLPIAMQMVRDMYRLTEGKVPIVGSGGVSSGQQAYDMIRAGASLVEIYSALAFDGPYLAMDIKRDLARLLRKDGYASVSAAVGAEHKKAPQPE